MDSASFDYDDGRSDSFSPPTSPGNPQQLHTLSSVPLEAKNKKRAESHSSSTITPTVNLLELAASALASAVAASRPIRKLARAAAALALEQEQREEALQLPQQFSPFADDSAPSNKNARIKLDGTIVTDADGSAQRIILRALRNISASIRIVGEESRREMEESRNRETELARAEDAQLVEQGVSEGGRDLSLGEVEGRVRAARRERINTEEMESNGIFRMAKLEIEGRYRKFRISSSHFHEDSKVGKAKYEIESGAVEVGTKSLRSLKKVLNRDDSTLGDSDLHDWKDEEEEDFELASLDDVDVEASRVSVFVDPLDGTKSYAEGDYASVTTLVAIIVDNVPVFGVIVKPFGQDDEPCILNSGCFAVYGGTLLNGAFIAGGDECDRSQLHRHRQKQQLSNEDVALEADTEENMKRKAVISRSRSGGVVKQCIDALSQQGLLSPEPIFLAGAGVKTLRLVVGTEDEALWFFPKPGTSLWDVAAADALLRVVGGKLTDKNGDDIDYSRSHSNAENSEGVVASCDAVLHSECIRIFREGNWDAN